MSVIVSVDSVAEKLEKYFDTAFYAPEGIKKLRELILTLAMQGKLVPQDANDQPASELLKEIEAEKQRLVKEGKIKKQKPLPLIKPEEMPYELPQGWELVRIRDICHDWGQKIPDSRFTYIDVGSIDNRTGRISGSVQVLDAINAPSRARKIVRSGTVIYSTVRPYLLNIAIIDKEYVPEPIASTAFAIIHSFYGVLNKFVYFFLKTPFFISYVESTMKGVAYPAINDNSFFKGIMPLPPFSEQHRIVAKIDQLMARCDELETLREEREKKQITVHTSAIKELLDAKNKQSLADAWQFLKRNFNELYGVKENVAELRKVILQLAVMGKLVPQDPNDPPASELLKEIEAEKQRLLKEGKIKKQKPLPPIKLDEVPYELPSGWEWVRFGHIAQHNSGKTLDKGRNTGKPRDYITTSNLYWGRFELENVRQMLIRDDELEKCTARKNDLLICEGGEAGRAAIWNYDTDICFQNHVHRARFYKDIDPEYAFRFFEKLNATREINQYRKGVGITNMSSKSLGSILFPLPPFKEQHRIVARIDQLMALCDTLEQQIDAADFMQGVLLGCVMTQI